MLQDKARVALNGDVGELAPVDFTGLNVDLDQLDARSRPPARGLIFEAASDGDDDIRRSRCL